MVTTQPYATTPDATLATSHGQSRRRLLGRGAALAAAAFVVGPGKLLAQTPAATPRATPLAGMLDFAYLDLAFTVPANPRRVAVMEGRGDLEFATIVGYPVIASGNSYWPDEPPGSRLGGAAAADIAVLSIGEEIDYEQLAAFHPDLIVMRANGFRADWYGNEILAQIAPILAVEVNRPSWREDLTAQAGLLGRSGELEVFLAAYDERLVTARAEAEPSFAGKKVYFITARPTDMPIWTNNFACAVAVDLGMTLPMFTSPEEIWFETSPEQMVLLDDADWIFRQVTNPEQAAALDEMALWQALPAVRAGKIWDISPQFNNGLAIQARQFLDVLVEASLAMGAKD